MMLTATAAQTGRHRLEPRAKLIALASLVLCVFFLHGLYPLVALTALLGAASWRVGGRGRMAQRIVLATAIGYPMSWFLFWSAHWASPAPGGETLAESALASGVFTLRIVVILLGNLLLLVTTDPRDFARSLRGWHLPAELCVMLMTVLRFLPLAGGQVQRIVDAQRCRGYRLRRLWRPTAWLPLCIPLLVSTLHRAEALAMSLELRGFTHGLAALAQPARWRWPDYVVAGCAIGSCLVLLLWGRE
jgi:energy-coupling factor transport system permease protein